MGGLKPNPLWDGSNLDLWVTRPLASSRAKVVETVEGDYVGVGAARENDLWIPFIELMWVRGSWPDIFRSYRRSRRFSRRDIYGEAPRLF